MRRIKKRRAQNVHVEAYEFKNFQIHEAELRYAALKWRLAFNRVFVTTTFIYSSSGETVVVIVANPDQIDKLAQIVHQLFEKDCTKIKVSQAYKSFVIESHLECGGRNEWFDPLPNYTTQHA